MIVVNIGKANARFRNPIWKPIHGKTRNSGTVSRCRRRAAHQRLGQQGAKGAGEHFHLDLQDFEARHHLTFDTYEVGQNYVRYVSHRTVFYKPREFHAARNLNATFPI